MNFIFVGLGNPGKEYVLTRHNTGRIILEYFRKSVGFEDWQKSEKYKGLFSEGKIGKNSVTILLPETFMNKSGDSISKIIKSKKQLEQLVVIHDDLDLPIGTYKMSWNRGTGGHRGVAGIVKTLKTEAFLRIRIGISPKTPSGKTKKPKGEEAVGKFILSDFKPTEILLLKKISKRIEKALESFVLDGREKTMSMWNG